MNDHEALERELAALRPVEPSPQLKARIARELEVPAAEASQPRRVCERSETHHPRAGAFRSAHAPYAAASRAVWLAVAGGALASSLAIYALWRSEQPAPALEPIRFRTESTTAAAFDAALPSLWSYRQALGRSYGDVDQLLDRHGWKPNEQPPSSQRAGVAAASVFARSDSQLETLLGEL